MNRPSLALACVVGSLLLPHAARADDPVSPETRRLSRLMSLTAASKVCEIAISAETRDKLAQAIQATEPKQGSITPANFDDVQAAIEAEFAKNKDENCAPMRSLDADAAIDEFMAAE